MVDSYTFVLWKLFQLVRSSDNDLCDCYYYFLLISYRLIFMAALSPSRFSRTKLEAPPVICPLRSGPSAAWWNCLIHPSVYTVAVSDADRNFQSLDCHRDSSSPRGCQMKKWLIFETKKKMYAEIYLVDRRLRFSSGGGASFKLLSVPVGWTGWEYWTICTGWAGRYSCL